MGEKEDDVPYVVLQQYAGHWEISRYPTSRVVRANCGHLSWLSPNGETMAAANYTMCDQCFQASWRPPDEEMVTVPGAVAALEALWGPETGAQVRDELRRHGIRELREDEQ